MRPGVTFEGLLPAAITPANLNQYVTSVGALLYTVYPADSNAAVDGTKVASRQGSPSDSSFLNVSSLRNITTAAYQITKLSDDIITVPTVIEAANIEPVPNQLQTGNSAPPAISGKVGDPDLRLGLS